MECRFLVQGTQPLKGNIILVQRYDFRRVSFRTLRYKCSNYSVCATSENKRGFGSQPTKKGKRSQLNIPGEGEDASPQQRKPSSRQSESSVRQAPGLSGTADGKCVNIAVDSKFNEKLEAVRRSAIEQKKAKENEQYGTIDYDTQIEPEKISIGPGAKIGTGVAVLALGLVFALGDFLPSGSIKVNGDSTKESRKLSEDEKKTLQERLRQYEVALVSSPNDIDALEGASVTLVELGNYGRAASLLEKLTKEKGMDVDVYRLLGEVKYEVKDYSGSVAAYKSALSLSTEENFEVLRGLVNALLAAEKPEEAVEVLLVSREHLSTRTNEKPDIHPETADTDKVDPIQIELLLGKVYSNWGHLSDAVSVYDRLISTYPNDFRGYLAKGIILKENAKIGDAERMFIQARFLAPDNAKSLVDHYSR